MSNSELPVGAHKAHQKRSALTTIRIAAALETLLRQKHFEQITMSELAGEAGITPGAIYRRFKNKDALIPAIYDRYQQIIKDWQSQCLMKIGEAESLENGLEHIIHKTHDIFGENAHIFRTVHLFGRLSLTPGKDQFASSHKNLKLEALAKMLDRFDQPYTQGALQFSIYTILTGAIERCFYPEFAPANLLTMDSKAFAASQASMIVSWLRTRP